MKYFIFLFFLFFFNIRTDAQLSNSEKKEFLEYSKRECPNNMIRKSANDPRFSSPQFIKLRNEIGNSKVKNQILKPAYKAYCDCLGTSIYSGDTISEATKTCGTYLKYEFKNSCASIFETIICLASPYCEIPYIIPKFIALAFRLVLLSTFLISILNTWLAVRV